MDVLYGVPHEMMPRGFRREGIPVGKKAAEFFAILAAITVLAPLSVSAGWIATGNPVISDAFDQQEPQMVTDGAGGAIFCWYEDRSGADLDIYAQRIDGAGNILWGSSGLPICTYTSDQSYPVLVSDGAGGAIIAWHDERESYYDVYAQRVNSTGHVQWTADGVRICSEDNAQMYPQIISDGAGGAIIVWMDSRYGSDVDLFAQRVDAGGVLQWNPSGEFVMIMSLDQYEHRVVPDGSGGAVIAFLTHAAWPSMSTPRGSTLTASCSGHQWGPRSVRRTATATTWRPHRTATAGRRSRGPTRGPDMRTSTLSTSPSTAAYHGPLTA